jgi:hypothetical protein
MRNAQAAHTEARRIISLKIRWSETAASGLNPELCAKK